MEKNDLILVINKEKALVFQDDIIRKAKKENKEIMLKNYKHNWPCNDCIYQILWKDKKNKVYIIKSISKEIFLIEETGMKKIPRLGQRINFCHPNLGWIKATVREIPKLGDSCRDYSNVIGAETDEKYSQLHTLSGKCKEGYGWYTNLKSLVEINEEQPAPVTPVIKDDIKDNNSEEINKLTEEIKKLTKEISEKERMQDLLNTAIIEKAKDIAVEDVENHLKENLDKFIEEKYGVLPKKIELITETTKKEIEGIFHKEFENICRIVKADIPLMLVGSAGAGKNYTLEQVAEALDLDFYFSNAVNQEYKLTGFIDANGTYHETEFYKAFTKGGMFFLDEIDASCPECLVILNSAIANRYFDFPTGRVKAHENFRVVCAGNTYGTGADMVYVGRNVLDGATLDRFVVLQFDYDEQVEKQLAYDENLYLFIKALRNAINEAHLRYIVSMRALINATKLLKLGVDKASILKTTIIKNMQIDDLNTIVNKVEKEYISDWTSELKRMCDNVRD